eukprot:TRINITY_DN5642_c0_g2_i2.p1 TRINITY_DN5642_c0_g2~~TRINITY_DN5642_c0_g2_i2.p1  ORF type:complete len:664 (-),score=81.95 TRINITY_DN5642_c0_g2_i2:1086-3077(-)
MDLGSSHCSVLCSRRLSQGLGRLKPKTYLRSVNFSYPRLPNVVVKSSNWFGNSKNQNGQVSGSEVVFTFNSSAESPQKGGTSKNQPNVQFLDNIKQQLQGGLKLFEQIWPMGTLFFLMAFVNAILDSMKDTLVVTAVGGGAQVIPYLTVYAVLPASLVFLVGYAFLSQRLNQEKMFNIIIGVFILFFSVFAFVWYPNHEALHFGEAAQKLIPLLPSGLTGMIGMIRNWTFTLFYVMSELWGDVGLSLLFWGLANEVTSQQLAPQVYPLFGIGANVAQVIAGYCLKGLGAAADQGQCSFAREFQVIMMMVCGACVAILGMHFWICRTRGNISQPPTLKQIGIQQQEVEYNIRPNNGNHHKNGYNGRQQLERSYMMNISKTDATKHEDKIKNKNPKKKGKKQKLSSWEAMKVVMSSKAIRCLALMTIAQGITINLMGFVWKIHLKMLHPSPAAFSQFMGDVAAWTGWVTGSLMLLAPILFTKFGWKGVAVTTPIMLTTFGVFFFGACFVYQLVPAAANLECLRLLTIGGAILCIVAKGAKFSLFKPAEEMVFIKLDEDSRTKGKAAIDVVGVQVGKAGVSLLQQALLLIFAGSLIGSLPAMCMIFFFFLKNWTEAVGVLADDMDLEGHNHDDSPKPPQSDPPPPSYPQRLNVLTPLTVGPTVPGG